MRTSTGDGIKVRDHTSVAPTQTEMVRSTIELLEELSTQIGCRLTSSIIRSRAAGSCIRPTMWSHYLGQEHGNIWDFSEQWNWKLHPSPTSGSGRRGCCW